MRNLLGPWIVWPGERSRFQSRCRYAGTASMNRLKRWVVMEAPTGQRFCVVREQRAGFPKNAKSWE
jgi:hypothetical protein